MIGQLIYNFKSGFNYLRGQITKDDYDWQLYHHHYRGELEDSKKQYTAKLINNDYVFKKGNLTLARNILPLHPNHRLLYETILKLHPASVLEVGCGWGDHLYNLQLLTSNLKIYGSDISKIQLELLKKRSPNLKKHVFQQDITLPLSENVQKVDTVFTQAVIMHIKTGNSHLTALANLFRIAKKHVILMENWSAHNFQKDIEYLYSEKMFPWPKIYSYYRRSPELGNRPHLMIISSYPLKFEQLKKYYLLK